MQQCIFTKRANSARKPATAACPAPRSSPSRFATIANNAVETSKKEILNIWESSKSDLLTLAASSVSKSVKDEVAAVKTDLKDEIVASVTDQEKVTAADRKAAEAADQEEKIRQIVKSVLAEKP